MPTGVLRTIGLFPVKSVGGFFPRSAEVGADGLVGDRAFVVAGPDGEALTAKTSPGLRDLVPTGSPTAPELPATAGPGLTLLRVHGGARQVAAVHVVTTTQRQAPEAGDSSRANLVCAFGADEPEPDAFAGARLVIGEVELLLAQRPRHCAGVFASVVRPGTVHVGDPVQLVVGERAVRGPDGAPG